MPVLPKYQRVTFEKDLIRAEGKPLAELVAPGHPLLEAVLDITLERHRTLLARERCSSTRPTREPSRACSSSWSTQ